MPFTATQNQHLLEENKENNSSGVSSAHSKKPRRRKATNLKKKAIAAGEDDVFAEDSDEMRQLGIEARLKPILLIVSPVLPVLLLKFISRRLKVQVKVQPSCNFSFYCFCVKDFHFQGAKA